MNIAIGLFVALALALLGTMIVLFNSVPRAFKETTPYTAHFTSAMGLSPGAPIRRAGVRVGEVSTVALDDEKGEALVGLALDKPYVVRHNEQVTLVTTVLGGDATIDIVTVPPPEGKPPDRTPYPPGSDLVGAEAVGVSTLLKGAAEVVPTTQETLNDIRKSIQRIERLAPLAEDTLREYRDFGRSLNASVPDLRDTNTEIQKLAKSSREAIPRLQDDADDVAAAARAFGRLSEHADVLLQTNREKLVRALDNLNEALARTLSVLSEENVRSTTVILRNSRDASEMLPDISRNTDELLKEMRATLRRLNDTLTRIDAASADVQKITKPLADRTEPITRNLDESLDKLNRTLTDLREIMRVVGQSDGTLNRILKDPSLFNHLDEAACAISKQMPQINQILKDVEVFTDKLARHPELIGVGGALRPSSGLKEPPTPPGAVVPPRPPGQ
jgi:phospholipid/cholesterol/gamma-HCH transport system substrate-binding protein